MSNAGTTYRPPFSPCLHQVHQAANATSPNKARLYSTALQQEDSQPRQVECSLHMGSRGTTSPPVLDRPEPRILGDRGHPPPKTRVRPAADKDREQQWRPFVYARRGDCARCNLSGTTKIPTSWLCSLPLPRSNGHLLGNTTTEYRSRHQTNKVN